MVSDFFDTILGSDEDQRNSSRAEQSDSNLEVWRSTTPKVLNLHQNSSSTNTATTTTATITTTPNNYNATNAMRPQLKPKSTGTSAIVITVVCCIIIVVVLVSLTHLYRRRCLTRFQISRWNGELVNGCYSTLLEDEDFDVA